MLKLHYLLMLTANAMLGLCCSSQADAEPEPEEENVPGAQTDEIPVQDSVPEDVEEFSDTEEVSDAEEISDSADESHEG